MNTILLNLASAARRVTLNGVDYLVAPITSIVPGVLNGSDGAGYYSPEDTRKSTKSWDGMPLTIYHPLPVVGGAQSASYEKQTVGKIKNSTFDGKLRHEAWFVVNRVRELDKAFGTDVERRLLGGIPIEVSTGLSVEKVPANAGATHNGRPYEWLAKNFKPDHMAVLPTQRGACSISDGCGVLVNTLNGGPGSGPHKGAGRADEAKGLRSQIEKAKESIKAAYEGAKADAQAADDKALEHADGIIDLKDHVSAVQDTPMGEAFNELDELGSNHDDTGTLQDRHDSLKDMQKVAEKLLKLNGNLKPGTGENDYSAQEIKDNHEHLTKIIDHAKSGRQSLKDVAQHRRAMRAIKEGTDITGNEENDMKPSLWMRLGILNAGQPRDERGQFASSQADSSSKDTNSKEAKSHSADALEASNRGDSLSAAKYHDKAAEAHRQAATKALKSKKTNEAIAHMNAAEKHESARDYHDRRSSGGTMMRNQGGAMKQTLWLKLGRALGILNAGPTSGRDVVGRFMPTSAQQDTSLTDDEPDSGDEADLEKTADEKGITVEELKKQLGLDKPKKKTTNAGDYTQGVGVMQHKDSEPANKATEKAKAATEDANGSDDPSDHNDAFKAHKAAADAHGEARDTIGADAIKDDDSQGIDTARQHGNAQKMHLAQAASHLAVSKGLKESAGGPFGGTHNATGMSKESWVVKNCTCNNKGTCENCRAMKVYNRDWPQGKRDKLASEDFAGPDKSFPITKQADVDSAAKLIGHATDPAAVKARIKSIAERKGLALPGSWKVKNEGRMYPIKNKDFASEDERKAAFAAMAEGGEGGAAGDSKAAGDASKHAAATGTAGAHRKAAEAHKTAAESHRSEGNSDIAKMHSDAAASHSNKATKAKVKNMDRETLLAKLIENCKCETEKAALPSLNTETLQAIANSQELLGKEGADQQTGQDYEDEEDDGKPPAAGLKPKKVKAKDSPGTMNEMLQNATDEDREVWKNAVEINRQFKLGLVRKLVANMERPAAEKAAKIYNAMKIEDLKQLAAGVQEEFSPSNRVTNYAGVGGPIADVQNVQDDPEDMLPTPVWNWAEIAKGVAKK